MSRPSTPTSKLKPQLPPRPTTPALTSQKGNTKEIPSLFSRAIASLNISTSTDTRSSPTPSPRSKSYNSKKNNSSPKLPPRPTTPTLTSQKGNTKMEEIPSITRATSSLQVSTSTDTRSSPTPSPTSKSSNSKKNNGSNSVPSSPKLPPRPTTPTLTSQKSTTILQEIPNMISSMISSFTGRATSSLNVSPSTDTKSSPAPSPTSKSSNSQSKNDSNDLSSGGIIDLSQLISTMQRTDIPDEWIKAQKSISASKGPEDDKNGTTLKSVIGYMRQDPSIPQTQRYVWVTYLCQRGMSSILPKYAEIRDNIYLTLVQQIGRDNNPHAKARGYMLMAALLGCFPPSTSESIQGPLSACLQVGVELGSDAAYYARRAVVLHDEVIVNGTRLYIPSPIELQALEQRSALTLTVTTVDPDRTFTIVVTSQTRVSDIYEQAAVALGVTRDGLENFGLYQTIITDDTRRRETITVVLKQQTRMMDVVGVWMDRIVDGSKKKPPVRHIFELHFKFQWCIRGLMFKLPDICTQLLFLQIIQEMSRGLYVCTIKEAIWLSALRLQIAWGDTPSKNLFIDELMPTHLIQQYTPTEKTEWAKEIEAERLKLQGMSQREARAQFLAYVQLWKVFMMNSFKVEHLNVKNKSDRISEIGVNEHGLFQIDPKHRNWSHICTIDKIISYECNDAEQLFKLVLGSVLNDASAPLSTIELNFKMEWPQELKRILDKYLVVVPEKGETVQRTLVPVSLFKTNSKNQVEFSKTGDTPTTTPSNT